jgi:hypothetical protein
MRRKYKMLYLKLLAVCSFAGIQSCISVKEYQKQYLNDAEMQLSARKSEKLENSFQVYREGASGATGGKTGGGCSCN